MAINNNDFQKYKNKVQGAVQQDIYSDINFQKTELFKQNIRSQQLQQGLSYNSYQNDIRRQLNNAANGILQQSQNGLIGSSALREMLANSQQAGQAISQTANSYAQSQMQANLQLSNANNEEQQLQQQYTLQEANKAYQADLQAGVDSEGRSARISSAVFGGLGALGAILSFIPLTAPFGLALDVISGAGMIGTDIVQESLNPTAGNATQLGIDTLFAGLSIIPGISAVKGLSKASKLEHGLEPGLEATTAAMKLTGLERNTIRTGSNLSKLGAELGTEVNPKLFYGAEQAKVSGLLPYNPAPPGSINVTKSSIINRNYSEFNQQLNNANSIEKVEQIAKNSNLTTSELKNIETEVTSELAKEGKNVENKTAFLTKYKNKLINSVLGKSTYERSFLAQQRFTNRTNTLIGARRVLAGSKSIAGTVARGVGRGVFLGGTHYITNKMLNSYLPGNNTINATQLK